MEVSADVEMLKGFESNFCLQVLQQSLGFDTTGSDGQGTCGVGVCCDADRSGCMVCNCCTVSGGKE